MSLLVDGERGETGGIRTSFCQGKGWHTENYEYCAFAVFDKRNRISICTYKYCESRYTRTAIGASHRTPGRYCRVFLFTALSVLPPLQ